jgi:DNA-binding CsgD family transcriptional regulator
MPTWSIVKKLLKGGTDEELSRELDISVPTVKKIVTKAFVKLSEVISDARLIVG